MTLLPSKYDGNGALWESGDRYVTGKPCMQGSIQIGGRKIALTIWPNSSSSPKSPNFNVTVNERGTSFDDMLWFKGLSPPPKQQPSPVTHPVVSTSGFDDDDIPF